MSPQPDQNTDRSVLSWESVLDANDTAPQTEPNAELSVVRAGAETQTPLSAPNPSQVTSPVLGDFDLTMKPLTLDPLPLVGDRSATPGPAADDNANVLGELHLELPSLRLDDTPLPAPPGQALAPADPVPATAQPVVGDIIDLTIAPLDIPDLTPSGRVPSVEPEGRAPAAGSPGPTATKTVSPRAPEVVNDASSPSAAVAALPTDVVSQDHAPTTVIAVQAAAAAAGAGAAPSSAPPVAVPQLPGSQLNQSGPRQAAPATASLQTPTAVISRRDRKHQKKLKKHQQKVALKKAKAASARSGAGGFALFFTLLVLAGLIAGAIIFGRPYLFPDKWDDDARPYGEAVEIARGAEFAEPVDVQRRAADVYATSMTAQLVGPWESELPTWRSFGLVSGMLDAPLLHELVEDWTVAYYSPVTGEVIANDAAGPALFDAAMTEAMTAAALDQETGWSASIDDGLLDAPALTRAVVIASSRAAAAATSYGAADTIRDIAVSSLLPPVIEYRANAPLAFAEVSTNDPTQRSADFEALRAASQLQLASEPELAVGDTFTSSQRLTDRTYWYLVFASYTDAATAYAASNALVQASLATADSAGRHCTYVTLSGTDVDGTAQVSGMLQQWVNNVPAEMTASLTTLATGTMQLRTCDPGVGFETLARSGVGREIARLRSVELEAAAAVPVAGTAADRAVAIAEVRNSQLGLPLLELAFDTTLPDSAEQARAIVVAASNILSDPLDPLDETE
ncbi:MAG: hypothetical protein HOH42_12525 [Ilumatobacter sp.]|uniref:hypothetical protein n=1 Tax=Ilumatobacter sp. TaxID=1967498 RepID=UPI00375170C3|nr:hypothetical protein [Ilumatobacter sp.]